MKRLGLLSIVISLALTSCEIEPFAGFSSSEIAVDIQEYIYFTNKSRDAKYYEWDFGDGTSSTAVNPAHKYSRSGLYTVTLTAISKDNIIDRAYQDIEVYFPPLEILVVEWTEDWPYITDWSPYAVDDISVWLYDTWDNWLTHSDAFILDDGFTDSEGWVVFFDVGSYVYYIDVYDDYYDNYQLASEDINWVRTPQLVDDDFNVFLAFVDYYPDGKKGAERGVIREFKRISKRNADQLTEKRTGLKEIRAASRKNLDILRKEEKK